jgi:hypothetical protein
MATYVRELSIPDLLRGTFEIYRSHFATVFSTFFLPVFPAAVIQVVAEIQGWTVIVPIAVFLVTILQFIAQGALTIAVSDVCLGHQPSTKRAYRRLSGGLVGKLFATGILVTLLLFLPLFFAAFAIGLTGGQPSGLLLALVFVILAAWFFLSAMFIAPIVILEGYWGFAAIKRSFTLARGYMLRNFAAFLLLLIVLFVAGGVLGAVFGGLLGAESSAFKLVLAAIQYLSAPLGLIAVLLLYYDLRARKEGYNMTTLAEDLMR